MKKAQIWYSPSKVVLKKEQGSQIYPFYYLRTGYTDQENNINIPENYF